jgi:hypothetical protein
MTRNKLVPDTVSMAVPGCRRTASSVSKTNGTSSACGAISLPSKTGVRQEPMPQRIEAHHGLSLHCLWSVERRAFARFAAFRRSLVMVFRLFCDKAECIVLRIADVRFGQLLVE